MMLRSLPRLAGQWPLCAIRNERSPTSDSGLTAFGEAGPPRVPQSPLIPLIGARNAPTSHDGWYGTCCQSRLSSPHGDGGGGPLEHARNVRNNTAPWPTSGPTPIQTVLSHRDTCFRS